MFRFVGYSYSFLTKSAKLKLFHHLLIPITAIVSLQDRLNLNDKPEQVEDSIGDMYVVMTILSLQLGLDIEDCVQKAYNEIKERKGKMINGVFVKESDLKE